jgi:peptidyl-dipeptidase Dcp
LAKAEIDAIVNNPEAPTSENTIVAMDYTGDIWIVFRVFS